MHRARPTSRPRAPGCPNPSWHGRSTCPSPARARAPAWASRPHPCSIGVEQAGSSRRSGRARRRPGSMPRAGIRRPFRTCRLDSGAPAARDPARAVRSRPNIGRGWRQRPLEDSEAAGSPPRSAGRSRPPGHRARRPPLPYGIALAASVTIERSGPGNRPRTIVSAVVAHRPVQTSDEWRDGSLSVVDSRMNM